MDRCATHRSSAGGTAGATFPSRIRDGSFRIWSRTRRVQAGRQQAERAPAGARGHRALARARHHGPLPCAQRGLRPLLQLPGRTDHGQQPDGRPPRLGPHVQGPLPALPHDARRAAALPERVRLPGALDRGRGREGARLQQQAPDRVVRDRSVRRAVLPARGPIRRPHHRAEQAARDVDGLGPQLLHELGREQLHDLGLPGRVPAARPPLPRSRRHDVVPALRDGHQQHGGGGGLQGRHPPVGHAAAADHDARARGRGPAGVDDDAVDAVEQRRRGGASGPHLPARGGRWRASLVGERGLEGARGRRCRGRPRGEGRRAGRPDLRRAVRRAPGGRRGRPSSHPLERGRRRRGHRHRPHRAGLRAGGLRAQQGLRPRRSSTPSTSSASSSTASAGRPAGPPAPPRTRRRISRATSSPTSRARGWSSPPSATRTPTRTAGAAGPS